MLRKTCLISHIILPVYISFGDEGCIKALACYVRSCSCMTDHLVFVFSVRQPPPAINPGNLEASEDKLRLSELSLGKAKRPRLVCAQTQAQNVPVLVGSLVLPAPSVVCG